MELDLLYNSSDSINRHGYRIHITAFEKSIKEVFSKGLPMLIGHDFHKPIGWTLPFGVLIEPELGRMVSRRLLATTENDQKFVNAKLQNFLINRFDERFDVFKDKFLTLLKDYLKPKFLRIDCCCIAVVQANLTVAIFKKLFDNEDDDGLIPLSLILSNFDYLSQGIFKHKTSDLCIFAHDFFRRSQSRFNNFHFQFIDELIKLKDKTEITIKIRLDKDMIGYSPSIYEAGELEFHWGPKYTDDISSIRTGLARHASLNAERRYSGVAAMEFYWKKDDEEITFEAEELMDTPSSESGSIYRCRYVHSIYNGKNREFIHFDGAYRSYDLEAMLDRIGQNFLEYGRKADYKKMFRLDGKIDLRIWKSLITHYYQGNSLIYEYFGLGGEKEAQKIKPINLLLIQRILPYENLSNEGIRVLLTYHEIPDKLKNGRYVDVLDVMKKKNEVMYSLEHAIYEVKGALYQLGQKLEISENIDLIKIDDQYWNIPSIMHYGEDDAQLLQKTVEAFILLFSSMISKKIFKVISLTLAFVINQRLVRISAVGPIQELLIWLKDSFPLVFSEDSVTNFVAKQRKYLDKYGKTDIQTVDFLLQHDGVLYMKRNAVLFPYTTEFDENGQMKFEIEFPKKENDPDRFFELMKENKIGVTLAIAIQNRYWSDTQENYLTAGRSKWLNDTPAHIIIDKCDALALYWVSSNYR